MTAPKPRKRGRPFGTSKPEQRKTLRRMWLSPRAEAAVSVQQEMLHASLKVRAIFGQAFELIAIAQSEETTPMELMRGLIKKYGRKRMTVLKYLHRLNDDSVVPMEDSDEPLLTSEEKINFEDNGSR